MTPVRRLVEAGGAYFLALAAAGWSFGLVREIFIRSGLDPVVAVSAEAPAMLLVIILASRWSARRFRVRAHVLDRLIVGALAVALLLASEVAGGALLREWSFRDFLENFTTVPGGVFALGLLAGLLMPLILMEDPHVARR